MGSPTENDWKLFSTVKPKDKASVLYYYLCLGNNMQEVAQNALNDYNDMASQRVSNITRCYGFSGQNGGRYGRYNLTLADIEGFVRRYPNGCNDYRIMDEYVRKLHEAKMRKQSVQRTQANPVQQKPNFDYSHIQRNQVNNTQNQYTNNDSWCNYRCA